MKQRKQKTVRKNAVVQRADVTLTKELANALTHLVRNGVSLLSRENQRRGFVEIPNGEKPLLLPVGTLQSWVTRGTVIPETGEVFRDVMVRARHDYRISEMKKKVARVVSGAEDKLRNVVQVETREPIRNASGVVKDPETGKVLYRENPALLKAQIDAAKFITERLAPERYGKVSKSERQRPALSLDELRRYEEQQKAATD